jgi:hypothetical protein
LINRYEIPVKASLYIIMNEKAGVVGWRVVPTDERDHIKALLISMYSTQNKNNYKNPSFFYTDNVASDTQLLQEYFNKIFPEYPEITVLQDIFHAEMRVIKPMQKQHPDYKVAVSELKNIFGKLKDYDSYLTSNHLLEQFNKWEQKFMKSHSSVHPPLEQILQLGKSIPMVKI